jgi:alkanesulfonate monooxygenase SsuD/methylene tetrahydromethanopterin reductase-like flavin-dependent oxidoreductase (luciferase family)
MTLAGLARDTTEIRLSVMMSNPSFRHPAVLAVIAAEADAMSGGGRVELGLGAGWYVRENEQFGAQMPATPDGRCDRRAEQIAILRGIWSATVDAPFTFDGTWYSLQGNTGLGASAPADPPRLILATAGTQRSIDGAVRHADECNVPLITADATEVTLSEIDAACDRLNRARDSLQRSASVLVCCGTTDAELERRAGTIGWSGSHDSVTAIVGDPREVREGLAPFLDMGLDRIYLQARDATDLAHVRLLADQVVGPLMSNRTR